MPPSSTPPRSRVGSSAASTIASTPRRLASRTIASPARRARTIAVATSTPSYSSPTAFARASAGARGLELGVGDRRVERQRHRHLEHPQRLDHRAALAEVLVLVGGEAAGGLDDVVVERRAEHRHQHRAVLGLGALAREHLLGHGDALEQRLVLAQAVDDVDEHAERHPAQAPPARAARGGRARRRTRPRRAAAPSAAGSGSSPPPMRTLSGILYGRSRSGSRKRSRTTDRQTIVNAARRAEGRDAEQELEVGGEHEQHGQQRADADDHDRRRARRVQVADPRRELAVDREPVAEPRDAEHRRVAGRRQHGDGGDRDEVAQRLAQPLLLEGGDDAEHRRLDPAPAGLAGQRRRTPRARCRRTGTIAASIRTAISRRSPRRPIATWPARPEDASRPLNATSTNGNANSRSSSDGVPNSDAGSRQHLGLEQQREPEGDDQQLQRRGRRARAGPRGRSAGRRSRARSTTPRTTTSAAASRNSGTPESSSSQNTAA